MLFEAVVKALDTMSKKVYRFDEEDLDPHDVPESMGNINALSGFFDAMILEARHTMIAENLDPMDIPDGVHKELNALIMSATLDINRISVHNLSNLERKMPFHCEYNNRVMTIAIPISFVDVKVFTDYKINAGYVVISEGRIMCRAGDISLCLKFSFDFIHRKLIFRDFDIPECEKLSVVFKGEGLTKYLLNVLTPIVIMSMKTILLSTIKEKVSEQITEGMEVVNRILKEMNKENRQKYAANNPQTSRSP